MNNEDKKQIEPEKILFNYQLSNEDFLTSEEKAKNSIAKIEILKEDFVSLFSQEKSIKDIFESQKNETDKKTLSTKINPVENELKEKVKMLETSLDKTILPTINNLAGSVDGLLKSGKDPKSFTEQRSTNLSDLFFNDELNKLTNPVKW